MSADQPPRDDRPATGADDKQVDAKAGGARGATGGRRREPADGDVGAALRTVYQRTVDERIPDEFLDLLGKLG